MEVEQHLAASKRRVLTVITQKYITVDGAVLALARLTKRTEGPLCIRAQKSGCPAKPICTLIQREQSTKLIAPGR